MGDSLEASLDVVLDQIPKAREARIGEANTKATLIEPLLAALGWEVKNFLEVERERKMYDGTLVDYALHVTGKPVVFIEAKPLDANLDDPKAVAQTVNYANQAGVVWCVLTDGNRYMLFKSNEPAQAPDKLLFEVRLEEAKDSQDQKKAILEKLRRLAKEAMASPDLGQWASAVFLDKRVGFALDQLMRAGDAKLARLLRRHVPDKKAPPRALQASLQRLAGYVPPRRERKAPTVKGKAPTGTVEAHLRNKPSDIVDLYGALHRRILSLGPDITTSPTKSYIAYRRVKNFACIEIRRTKLLVLISLPPSSVEIAEGSFLRDVSDIGHYGTGDLEATLSDSTHMDEVASLIERAYHRGALTAGRAAAQTRKQRRA